MNEGYIKFDCRWIEAAPVIFEDFQEINQWRNKLHQLGLIGMYPDKIGFGNISIRDDGTRQFYITGSATGGLDNLTENHYTLVTDYNFSANSLTCRGPIKASLESLTHAAVYLAAPQVNTVIHVHHLKSWEGLLGKIPTTSPKVAYGTPEMAQEIFRLFDETDLKSRRVW